MKKILPFVVVIFLGLSICSQAQSTFQKLIRSATDQTAALDIAVSADNNFGMAGMASDTSFNDILEAYVVKTDASGQMIWNKVIDMGAPSYAISIAKTSDNGFIVAGAFGGHGFVDGVGSVDTSFIMKFTAGGQVQWARTFYAGDYYCRPHKVLQSSDGGYLLLGRFEDLGSWRTYLLKLNAAGQYVWLKNFSGSVGTNDFVLSAMMEQANGQITLAGIGYAPTSRFIITQLSANGSVAWCRSHKIDDGWDYKMRSIHLIDGNYHMVVKNSSPDYDENFIVYTTDQTGSFLHGQFYTDTVEFKIFEIMDAVTQGENILITGIASPNGKSFPSATLMQIDTAGNINWTKYYGDGMYQAGHAVDVMSSGFATLVGDNYSDSLLRSGTSYNEIYFLKTDPYGNVSCHTGDLVFDEEAFQLADTACLMSIVSHGKLDTLTYSLSSMYSDTTVCVGVGIDDPEPMQLTLYPNPSAGNLYLSFEKPLPSITQIVIYDLNGRQVALHQLAPGLSYANLSNSPGLLSPGVYIVKVVGKDKTGTLKWIIGQ